MSRRNLPSPSGQAISIAQRRLQQHQQQVPQGARFGAMAGQAVQAPMSPAQYQQWYEGRMAAQNPGGMVPAGADAGALGACGETCGPLVSPFAGMPSTQGPLLQNCALLGIFVQPATTAATTLEISCGNTFFQGIGARSFGAAEGGENLLTSIISGFNNNDLLCPGSGIDVAFFNTRDTCWCDFDFGCFSNLAPLLLTFDPVDTQSVLAPLNMVIVGRRLSFFNECWPWFPPPVVPPGAYGGGYAAPVPMPGGYPTP